jgi:hypothetical protein
MRIFSSKGSQDTSQAQDEKPQEVTLEEAIAAHEAWGN